MTGAPPPLRAARAGVAVLAFATGVAGLTLAQLAGMTEPARAQSAAPDTIVGGAALRNAGETLALWARGQTLSVTELGALAAQIAGGASLAPDDPFGAAPLRDRIAAAAAPAEIAAGLESVTAQARGVWQGVTRLDLTLPPGARQDIEITMAAGEPALVEIRLKPGPQEADVDLLILDATGTTVAEDLGPMTGRPGVGALTNWQPASCGLYSIRVENRSAFAVEAVVMAPPSRSQSCDG
ncbi:hypothetical protein ACRARG_06020 [Pseudooceanicola sp. C21-150M6]|uniref:hypothetical protein n=1 Tax=Pseudooceanicola sp. C21-150M6 TaxID=3434355 RepID=UPI003D7F75D0